MNWRASSYFCKGLGSKCVLGKDMGLMFVWILFDGGPNLVLELNQSVWDFVFGFSFVPTGL